VNITRRTGEAELRSALAEAEFVFRLAAVNRPKDDPEFNEVNAGLTATVCAAIRATDRHVPLVYAHQRKPHSTTRADALCNL